MTSSQLINNLTFCTKKKIRAATLLAIRALEINTKIQKIKRKQNTVHKLFDSTMARPYGPHPSLMEDASNFSHALKLVINNLITSH